MKRTSDGRRIKAGEQLDDDFDIKNTPPLELVSRVLAENMHGHRWLYALAVVAMIVVAVTSAATAWIMEAIFNVLSGAENEYDSWVVSIAVMMIFALKGGASYVQQVTLTRAGSSVVAKLQRRLYAKLLMQDALWFENTDSSKILVHVTQSAGAARTVIDVIVTSVIRDALTLVGMVGVMVWQNAVLSLVFFVVMPVALLSVRVVMGRVSAVTREGFVGQAEINKVIRETSTGLRVIRSFGLERLLQVRMDSAIRDGQVRANTISRFESLTLPLMDTLAGFAIGIVIMANTFSGKVGTPASAGEIMAFIAALLMAYEPAKRLSRVRVTLEAAFNGVRMMFSILDMPDAIADAPDAVDLPRGKGAVSFKNVTFAYSRKKPILNNLTLDFAPGKVTAIVGPSGGGKSTIMSLLLRVYDPKAGKITIDGFDLRHVTRASLRHVLSYAGQNTFLFSTSVRDNIRMGRENATDSEVEAAAKCAQAHDFIMALPNGYDTQVGENGIFFSGGQRQRLSLARAILKDAPVLLLDEATSALDNYSEGLVRDAITQVTTGRTTIFIAHRLSTVMVADEVMYIEAGQLVEHGPLQELLNSDTRFAALFRKERTIAKSKSDRKLKSLRSDIWWILSKG